MQLSLRKSVESDLETFFLNQLDEEANYMAAFTAKDPSDKEGYKKKWLGILNKDDANIQTILLGDVIAGSVFSYEMEGEPQVSYWIGKEFWGQGIATRALTLFLKNTLDRPIYGRIAADNIASKRVLEKCGFEIEGYEQGYANARGKGIDEIVFKLL